MEYTIGILMDQQNQMEKDQQMKLKLYQNDIQTKEEKLKESQQKEYSELFQYLKNEEQKVNKDYSRQLKELEEKEFIYENDAEKIEENRKQKINSLTEYFNSAINYLHEKHQSEQLKLQKESQELMDKVMTYHTKQKMELKNFLDSRIYMSCNKQLTEEKRETILNAIESAIGHKPTFDELKELARQLNESHYIILEREDFVSESSIIRWFEINWKAINS